MEYDEAVQHQGGMVKWRPAKNYGGGGWMRGKLLRVVNRTTAEIQPPGHKKTERIELSLLRAWKSATQAAIELGTRRSEAFGHLVTAANRSARTLESHNNIKVDRVASAVFDSDLEPDPISGKLLNRVAEQTAGELAAITGKRTGCEILHVTALADPPPEPPAPEPEPIPDPEVIDVVSIEPPATEPVTDAAPLLAAVNRSETPPVEDDWWIVMDRSKQPYEFWCKGDRFVPGWPGWESAHTYDVTRDAHRGRSHLENSEPGRDLTVESAARAFEMLMLQDDQRTRKQAFGAAQGAQGVLGQAPEPQNAPESTPEALPGLLEAVQALAKAKAEAQTAAERFESARKVCDEAQRALLAALEAVKAVKARVLELTEAV